MDIWVVSTFELFWIMLLWTLMYKVLYGHMLSFLLIVYLGVELLGHLVTLCLAFWRTARLFSITTVPVHIPTSSSRVPVSPHPHQCLLLFVFFVLTILVCVKWYLIVVLICFCLKANDEHLVYCLLAIFICSLEKCLFKSLARFFKLC